MPKEQLPRRNPKVTAVNQWFPRIRKRPQWGEMRGEMCKGVQQVWVRKKQKQNSVSVKEDFNQTRQPCRSRGAGMCRRELGSVISPTFRKMGYTSTPNTVIV